jgi:ABC-type nickel/cobalt efflux system permease component RcnA
MQFGLPGFGKRPKTGLDRSKHETSARMEGIVELQRWLYSGMANGLGDIAGGDAHATVAAMLAAALFGAVHALMPGHGKAVLVSYHLGQPAKALDGLLNGAILALTHVGTALVLVLAGFGVISRAFAYGGRTPGFEAASGVLIVVIGGLLLWRLLNRRQHANTQNGRALAFVTGIVPCPLTTFIMSYALARGLLAAGLLVTAAMALGMIATIGGIALAAALTRGRFVGLLARTESWRHGAGTVLEVGGSAMVFVFGLWTFYGGLT